MPGEGHCRGKHGASGRTKQDAAGGTAAGHGADQPTPAGRRVLDHEDDRGRIFAANRKTLDRAQCGEEDGSHDAQQLVAGQDPDQEGRDSHRHHRKRERGGTAKLAPDMADKGAANRPPQVTNGEDAESCQHLVVGQFD